MSGVFSGNQWTTPSGSSWNIIIEPDLVNQVAELANHLSVSNKENRPTAEKLVEQAQAATGDNDSKAARSDVVRNLLALVSEKGLYQGVEARDLEGFVNLAAALVNAHLEDTKEVEDSLVKLSAAVSKAASGESSATLSARYSALSSLYNSLPESTSAATRSAILLNLFKLAAASDDLSLLRGAVAALPTWLTSEWNISEGADQYLLTFVEALESASDKEEAGELVRRLLLDSTNANTSDELKSKLLLYTLASSTVFDVEALPVPSTSSSLVQLREIFLTGGLKDLSNVSDLPAPLDQTKLTEKLQYVLLADFASTKVGQDVSYEEVAGALGLQTSGDEEDQAMEVESWIIATIRSKLLTARLHQPSNSVSIIRATPRRFEAEQWKTLQTRLEAWKASIGNILETVGRAVGPHPSTRGQQQAHDAQSLHSAAHQQQQQRQQEVVEVV